MSSDLFDSMIGKPEHADYNSAQGPWAAQQPYLQNMFASAANQYNANPSAIGAQSPYTLQAQQMAATKAQDPNSLTSQSQGLLGDTISGKYLDPNSNPYLKASVQDALGLAGSTFAGQYGGQAGQNLGNTGYQESLARGLGAVATNAYSNAYGQERQNQLTATGMAPQFDFAQANALGLVGAQQDARSQAEVDAPWKNLANLKGAVGGQYGTETNYQMPWNNQMYQQMFGYGGMPSSMAGPANTFGSAIGGMFSDVRLKENIERIGTHDKGIGIYKYNYIGDPTPQIGVLAQEVEKVLPEAVGESQGFKTVNYKMI